MNTTELPADATKLSELNVESRTILLFKVDEAELSTTMPAGWQPAPINDSNHPAFGANLLVIFSDRLIVQNVAKDSVKDNATNQLVILGVQAQHSATNERGVVIMYGLSAQPEGAPGPYGVYLLAKGSKVERVLSSSSDKAGKASEKWDFVGDNKEKFFLEMNYDREVPNRSNSLTRAYSYKDPIFYRIYDADQGVVVLRSIPKGIDKIANLNFQIKVPQLSIELTSSQLVSVLSQPWIVRRTFLPPYAAVLQLQDLNPDAYTIPYLVKEQTLYFDSPSKPSENGLLLKEQKVWLDKDISDGAQGICKVKLEDNRLMYILAVENLAKK